MNEFKPCSSFAMMMADGTGRILGLQKAARKTQHDSV